MFQTGNNRGEMGEFKRGSRSNEKCGRKCGILERKSCQKTMDNDSHNGEDVRQKEVEKQEYRGRQKNISALK